MGYRGSNNRDEAMKSEARATFDALPFWHRTALRLGQAAFWIAIAAFIYLLMRST
jgi:hypothetical protein